MPLSTTLSKAPRQAIFMSCIILTLLGGHPIGVEACFGGGGGGGGGGREIREPQMAVDCQWTPCTTFIPSCPSGYEEMDRDRNGCPSNGESKNYCCRRGMGPACITTSCTTFIPSCPSGYAELDRDRITCPKSQSKNVCCKPHYGPQCFTTSCTTFIPSCPSPYRERQRLRGNAADCPETGMSRNVCCR